MASKVEPVRISCSRNGCTNVGPWALTRRESVEVLARALAKFKGWKPCEFMGDEYLVCPQCQTLEDSTKSAEKPNNRSEVEEKLLKLRRLRKGRRKP